MVEEEPLYSKKISSGSRAYYIDAHVDKKGQPYIAIAEIPTDKFPGMKRRRVLIHAEHIELFAKKYSEVSQFINKLLEK